MKGYCIILLLCIVLSGCNEVETETFSLPALVKGNVTPRNQFGRYARDFSGVTVSVEDTDVSVQTDEEGEFLIDGLRSGTYNFIFEKEGFATVHRQGEKLIGGDEPHFLFVILNEKSTTYVTDLTLNEEESFLYISGNLFHDFGESWANTILYLSRDPEVSAENFEHTIPFWIDVRNGQSFTMPLYVDDLFKSGSVIYAKAYGISSSDYGYYDIETGKTIYPTICDKPSETASIVVP